MIPANVLKVLKEAFYDNMLREENYDSDSHDKIVSDVNNPDFDQDYIDTEVAGVSWLS
jgi:hypothetical protein